MAAPVPATPLVMGWSGDQRVAQAPVTLTISAQDPVVTTGAAVAATGASEADTPWGYTTEAQANAIVTNINTLRTDMIAAMAQINALRDDIIALTAIVNAYVVA